MRNAGFTKRTTKPKTYISAVQFTVPVWQMITITHHGLSGFYLVVTNWFSNIPATYLVHRVKLNYQWELYRSRHPLCTLRNLTTVGYVLLGTRLRWDADFSVEIKNRRRFWSRNCHHKSPAPEVIGWMVGSSVEL